MEAGIVGKILFDAGQNIQPFLIALQRFVEPCQVEIEIDLAGIGNNGLAQDLYPLFWFSLVL